VNGRVDRTAAVVERRYLAETDACERAIRSLLAGHVNKAAEPTPEPDGRDGTKAKESSADEFILPH
jgi:hypothetical protein